MPVYTTAIVDCDGRFDPSAFRQAFLQSLQRHNYDVNAFLIPARIPSSNRILPVNQPSSYALSGATLEELSEEDEDDEHHHNHHHEEEDELLQPPIPLGEPLSSAAARRRPRLKLVVDLDNTLVHAQSKFKLNGIEPELYEFRDAKGDSELFRFVLPKHQGQAYYLKLRPGAVQFLKDISQYYDVAVHTNATQEYADIVLSVLDPDRSVIGLRVVARDDESSKDERKDMNRLFSGDREKLLRQLLILDDRRDVWDGSFERNIIQCHYYEYFETRKEALTRRYPPSGDNAVFRPYVTGLNWPPSETPFPVTLEPSPAAAADPAAAAANSSLIETDELLDDDRQLFFIKDLMRRIAEEWYAAATSTTTTTSDDDPLAPTTTPDISEMLAQKRSQILAGCVVLMTGYHKVEQASQYGMLDNGPQHRRRLEFMGATVTEQAGPDVTHVIVMRQTVSTDRARTTCGKNTHFVHNLWIYACEHAWTRVDESLFEATSVLTQFVKPSPRPLADHWRRTKECVTDDYYSASSRGGEIDRSLASTPVEDRQQQLSDEGGIGVGSSLTTSHPNGQGADDDDTNSFPCDHQLEPPPCGVTSEDVTVASSANSQPPSRMKRRLSQDNRNIRRRRLAAISNIPPLPRVYGENVWPSTGPWSNGAEVWGALEHVVLRYDSFLFEQIKKKSLAPVIPIT